MIKVGIVGMGIRGSMFARFASQNPYVELATFSEPDEKRKKQAEQNWKVKGYSSYDEMYEKESFDAVIITTPDFMHRDPVIKALGKKLHVLVEKPFSQRVEEAEEMLVLSRKVRTKCMIAYENRWNPVVIQAKKQISNNELGPILTINGLQSNTVFVPLQMISWASQTTCGWFLLSHLLDMTYFLTGKEAVSVYAHGTKKLLKERGVDTYDYIHSLVKFDDGTDGMYESLWCLPESFPHVFDVKCSFYGEKGFITVDFGHQMIDMATTSYKYLDSLLVDYGKKLVGFPGYMFDDFIDCIRLDLPSGASFEDGYRNTRLLVALHRSLQSGLEEKT
ncbi:MAG: Gfo/Idh/MocA family oxidoreductase [Candidatus Atribacteria bacterium]|nr:Gfo/Idh/MocA family oxidoreductase [Candidatus Atribacteria bacterium]